MDLKQTMEYTTQAVEIGGVAILLAGVVYSLALSGLGIVQGRHRDEIYEDLRRTLGRAILLGVEVLVVADLIYTVVIDRTLDSVLGLSLIVLVRTLLSFSLQIELDGTLPWRKNG